MAVVLDINMCCKKTLNIKKLVEDYGIAVKSIGSIDNWRWENQQKLDAVDQITNVVNMNKIIIIELMSSSFKNSGIYIEKINSLYIYTFWMNTEGYPEMDRDAINSENSSFYEKIYQVILNLENLAPNTIETVGIGIETYFSYSENLMKMIRDSRNMNTWILDGSVKTDKILEGYKKRKLTKFMLFERVENE